jgi:ABC transport system ATP-binding/permease protein
MPTLVVTHPDGRDEALELGDELTIGRGEENSLVLRGKGVSRAHARLFVQDDGNVYVEDMGSSNGTFLSGERVNEPTLVEPAVPLVIGDYTMVLRSGGRAARPSAEAVPRSTRQLPALRDRPKLAVVRPGDKRSPRVEPGTGAYALRGMVGPWLNELFPLEGLLRIGRSSTSDIHIEDDSVSRQHAEVEVSPEGGVLIRDLGARNGTLINGEPLVGEIQVLPGDVITFGSVDWVLEEAGIPRRGSRSLAVREDHALAGYDEAEGPEGEDEGRGGGRVGMVVLVLVLLGVGAVGTKWFLGRQEQATISAKPTERPRTLAVDPAAEFQAALSQCRTFSAIEVGVDPDWDKAESACRKALDLDPIHPEAMQLDKKVKKEREAFSAFQRGEKALSRGNEAEALQALSVILPESGYYARAKGVALEAAERVKKDSAENCRRYANAGRWKEALKSCESYLEVACQDMEQEALTPPPNHKLSLSGRLKPRQWRPKDANYVRYLSAQQRLKRPVELFECPAMPIVKKGPTATDQRGNVAKLFEARYPDKVLSGALLNYWLGRGSEASVSLLRLTERTEKAELHEEARRLQQDISTVDQLFKTGQGALQSEDPERAAKVFQEALELDSKLMDKDADTHPSHYKRNIQQDMAAAAYLKGVHWADRQDVRRACKMWKLGFGFYQANPDLNKAVVNVCSARGSSELQTARTCADLVKVLDFAVEGDGLVQKVQAKRGELQCP